MIQGSKERDSRTCTMSHPLFNRERERAKELTKSADLFINDCNDSADYNFFGQKSFDDFCDSLKKVMTFFKKIVAYDGLYFDDCNDCNDSATMIKFLDRKVLMTFVTHPKKS